MSSRAISPTPLRITETSFAPSGSADPCDALAGGRRVRADVQLDELEALAAELEQLDEAVLGHLVLDEAEEAGGRADRLRDPEDVEVRLVARVVDAGDRLRHAVALLGDLRDHDVVLVVAGDREHDLGRPGDAGALEHVDLGRVALEHDRPELRLELLPAVAPLLDQRHLVPHLRRASA